MKNVVSKFKSKNYAVYLGIFFLAFSLVACSDDDDGVAVIEPTGFFEIEEEYNLTGNTLILESITVGQDSWLVAVNPGDENTDNFISDPVWLDEGVNTNVQLTFDENAIDDDGTGQVVVLKLYADDPIGGTVGEWDELDEPITNANNALVIETITVYSPNGGTAVFADFDTNNDGLLDASEVSGIYVNDFDTWDADNDGFLSADEFYNTSFLLTDADDDDFIDEDEWIAGYNSWYGTYIDDDFATYDVDADGTLDSSEWNDVFADSGWFEFYDTDEDDLLTDTEWDAGLFNDWDLDEDDFIDEDEYDGFIDFVTFW